MKTLNSVTSSLGLTSSITAIYRLILMKLNEMLKEYAKNSNSITSTKRKNSSEKLSKKR